MNTNTRVEVYLGNPITVASEALFLARLWNDLVRLGVSARILANLHLGADDRQVDFVVITADHVVQVELKVFPGAILSGPKNGRWKVRVGAGEQEWRDPMWQALQATHALSDVLHAFAQAAQVPGARRVKFYGDVDTVVCAFPALPDGSSVEPHRHVSLVGYDELLDILQRPGPSLAWSSGDWDAFGRHLNLYRDEEDSPEGLIRAAGAAAVDEYLGRYLQEQGELGPLVPTAVRIGEREAPRPDLPEVLAAGGGVLLAGGSEAGKTLWAKVAACELARAGHVPIWLAAEVCEESFRTATARAIAPYSSLSPNELLRAADAAGRAIVFVIDDLTKASDRVQKALISGAQTARVRNATRGLLITAQSADAAAGIPACLTVELALPDDAERRALLDAYGEPELIDRCAAFITPMDLSLAAACADELVADAGTAELLDLYVDRVTGGDVRLRGSLRAIAWRMHSGLVPSLARPEVTRLLRREHGLSDHELQAALDCPLVSVAHGRVSFRHERFEHFLAAEALLLSADETETLAITLNTPVCARLRADVIALESQEERLTVLLSACEDADVLVDAAIGRLGGLAARVVDALLVDAVNVACAETGKPGIRLTFEGRGGFSGVWVMPDPPSRASQAQWAAAGRLLRRGRFIDGAVRLLAHTDRLCDAAFEGADVRIPALLDQIFAAAYAIGPGGLPASTLMRAAVSRPLVSNVDSAEASPTALALLNSRAEPGPGVLYLAAHLLDPDDAPTAAAHVIVECLASDRYHLCLSGLSLAERSARYLDDESRRRVLDAINSLPTDNLGLNTSIVEALSALGEITPARDLDDVRAEIAMVLEMKDTSTSTRMAYGLIAAQFEPDVIGPYYEAVSELSPADRERLLILALEGNDSGTWVDWILGEFKDLSNPDARRAVAAFVANADPERWLGQQEGMAAVIEALRLLVADGAPLPEPAEGGCTDPSWRAALTIITGALNDIAGTAIDTPAVDDAWAALLGEHRDVFASFLSNLHGARVVDSKAGVYEQVLSTLPAEGVEALIWSLEHYDQTRPLCRWDHDLPARIVEWLGQIGDRRAAEVLRRFTSEPGIGEAAAAAVRQIEARARVATTRDAATLPTPVASTSVTTAPPGSVRPEPDAIRQAVHRLTDAVAAHLPRHIPPGGSEWDFYGPAMISRMVDTVESVVALMDADRAVDGAVLVRVLYEHVVKFCWISIDPTAHYPRWQTDSDLWDRKLRNDAIATGLLDEQTTPTAGLQSLPDMAQLADALDRYWPAHISAFTPRTKGLGALVTFRGLYLPVYRTASEAVHGRPAVLDAYMSRGSHLWRMGPQAASSSMFWPLIVPLFAWALLVCHHQWDWPNPELVLAANNGMYGVGEDVA